MGIPAGAKAAPRGGAALEPPTASQPQPVTVRDVPAKTFMEQPASRTQPLSCPSKNSQIERLSDTLLLGIASKTPHGTGGCRASTLLGVVTTLTNRRAARCIAAGMCRGSWRPQGYPGMCKQKPSRNKGLPCTVKASGCCNDPHRSKGCHTRCFWEVSRLVKAPGISRDVPAKTLTEQGAAAHVSKLLDVVATLTNRRAARRVAAGRCRGS